LLIQSAQPSVVPKLSLTSVETLLAAPRQVATAVPLDNAVNPHVRKAIAYWRSLCGQRRFPARADMTLRGLAPILPYAVIVGVVDGGADFEYRYVGEAQREAFKTSFKGLRVSQIEAAVPELGALLRGVYEQARATGEPFIARGRVDHEPENSKFLYHESVFLPLGASAAVVDHILVVGVQIPTPFWDIPTDELINLSDKVRA
jgi:hypothetical protein